jgi:hypothetical protein
MHPASPRFNMKKDEVKVGSTYAMAVSGKVVAVRIVEEKWTGDKHTGWTGVNTMTNRPVRIRSAQKLRREITPGGTAGDHNEQCVPESPSGRPDAPVKPSKPKGEKQATAPKSDKPKKLSGLDAAAQVLKDAGKPMNFKDITDGALAKGWRTNGKTPQATLYAAAIREIAAKGKDARFSKTERGMFEHSGVQAE